MSYHPRGRSLTRACWRDGRGALRCKRPDGLGDAESDFLESLLEDFGVDSQTALATGTLNLGGSSEAAAKAAKVTLPDFLIAQLNRFKGKTPSGQSIGGAKFAFGNGINDDIALDALTVVGRRLSSGVAAITADAGARQLLADTRALLGASDQSGLGALVAYVTKNVSPIGFQVAAYADSLNLPPPVFPTTVAGLSGLKLFVAAGAVGAVALFFMTRRTP